ncbi:tRNA selenocysteine 1-associated protein 1-like [Oppia nitens]|uniref:tRNA selenocysteine 1-associated protein 1-like n=1 Tax=Oppia nitens TaxID=1686743 RepID=UPI0023DAFE78|nr:tRNA selenocysteine 1-associated protein 1-like [Oppia nitens]
MSHKYQNQSMTLWIGDIDETMDEMFVKTSFHLMSHKPKQVKIVRNKITGQPMGYGFITFESEELAQKVLNELNGQQIPNAAEGKRFRLNITSSRDDTEFSIYVGDLTLDVNDHMLLNAFAKHYPSTCSAKVMTSESQNRRFGFVRFSQESDYQNALSQCNNSTILGPNPITVRAAKPRRLQRQNYGHQRTRTYDRSNSERFVIQQQHHHPQQQQQQPPQIQQQRQFQQQNQQQFQEISQPIYSPDMSTGSQYSAVSPSSGQQPIWIYPMMPYNALPVNYDSYAYGQPSYGQPVYYPNCDNMLYTLIPGSVYMPDASNQYIDDKFNEEMMAKNDDLYSSIENTRWSTPIESEKESKMQ